MLIAAIVARKCQIGAAGLVKERGFHNLSPIKRNMGKTWTMTQQVTKPTDSTDLVERPWAGDPY
jgi:hypothetical protein